jgi:lysophospholipase L1-like esterase
MESVMPYRRVGFPIALLLSVALLLASPAAVFSAERPATNSGKPKLLLIGIGDSLTHGTMDATNNATNTLHAYLQKIADALGSVSTLTFSQPLFDDQENRMRPFEIPTNVGVDGADSFSVEGIQYYRRAGAETSYVTDAYLADVLLPSRFADKYDKVFYPINVKLRKKASMIDSAVWLMNQYGGVSRPVVVFWVGNNDSSSAALGEGGVNPTFLPIPFEQVAAELTLLARTLLAEGEAAGDLSFEPYTPAALERNLTLVADFAAQYGHLLSRLKSEVNAAATAQLFLLTLPYYSSVGYLMDSEDLEFYFRKLNPDYTVPPSFKRVAPPGEPITDPMRGDRISLLTFGFMYALLDSGYSVDYVNAVLETNGEQRDGMVLSESEQAVIRARIDSFNAAIRNAAAAYGPNAHVVEIADYLNDGLSGKKPIVIGDTVLSRKWIRGSSFGFDGVHPNHTAQALIANFVLGQLNATLGLNAPLHDLAAILATDPYVDRDGDGFAPGPSYRGDGIAELLFLFKDPDDTSAGVQPVLPFNVWELISRALLKEFLGG